MSIETTKPQTIEEECKAFLSRLREHHLINARIFVTSTECGNCKAYDHGTGDWYSTFGAIVEWVETQKQRAREQVKAEAHDKPGESFDPDKA